MNTGHHHALRLSTCTCLLCSRFRMPRQSWFEVEHKPLDVPGKTAAMYASFPVRLVARRPPVRGGVGRIELSIRDVVVGYVAVQLCGVDLRGVLVHVAVADGFRRRGIGGLMLDAAFARGVGYAWSTAPGRFDDVEVKAFRASLDLPVPVQVGEPFYCSHMREALGEGI
ncbi:GNAT family N-acetyltransferase [Amycolatopsis rhabdoformis]|uniref:GNAT family N-acetyltransferase n=1 Tax=Amycolatopsis rhabdoformis TaxID=1448059 RepID=A0ABZ1I1Z1_9PSEU|nr:GNAT family N-acetyltransferase [Amycolatopsis rhabdoformis]WSE28407.1 GNAT family N-acetyltransferase [Amycolatopsis rhabdoformis]